jgi:enoyl-CoA hydratase/carnithine racemase
MNAIDDDVPVELAVARANADAGVHVIALAGAGEAFCAGYDLTYYAQGCDPGDALGSDEGRLTLRVERYASDPPLLLVDNFRHWVLHS